MHSSPSQPELLEFLRCDPMRNIVPLKMLTAHGTVIQSYFQRAGNEAGALLLFPITAFPYDQQTYGDRDTVVLLVATTATIIETLLTYLPANQKFVFKLASDNVREVVAQHYPILQTRAFISYTTDPNTALTYHAAVRMTDRVDEQLYTHYAAHGHTPTTIADQFADGAARAFTLYQGQRAVAACFTYRNFEDIHEIGGVLTLPNERRKGYAKIVAESALHALNQRGLTPRYQVDATNLPSVKLAEALGLSPFVTVEHWLNLTPARRPNA